MTKSSPSSAIPIEAFRQILIWPLRIHILKVHADKKAFLDEVTSQLNEHHWKWESYDKHCETMASQLQHLSWYGADKDFDYSEMVYFHSYVRDFLYGGDATKAEERPLRVFRRDDLKQLKVRTQKGRDYILSVHRVEGYLFELGVFLIVVDVEYHPVADQPFSLAEMLNLQNELRMVFPRRWSKDGGPKESPLRACWLDDKNVEIADTVQDFTRKDDFTRIVREHAELPAAKHWRYLLKPFPLYGEHKAGEFAFKQIEDQRIPSMSYIAVPDPRLITKWDFARIAYLDSSGNSNMGSYADPFLNDWHKTAAYDRFWEEHPSAEVIDYEKVHTDRDYTTRWLCSGYGLAVVGRKGNSFFDEQIAANFRHHYFRMGLIVHFHRAALLSLRDDLAEATKQSGAEFRQRVQAVQQKMTEFRTRFWFREVSTQLQGQEFFSWWSGLLKNQNLFDEVASDIAAADAQVRTQYEEERTSIQEREMKTINSLTILGGGLGCLSIVLSTASLIVSFLAIDAIVPVVISSAVTISAVVAIAYVIVKYILPVSVPWLRHLGDKFNRT